jgi:phage-related protein
VGKDLKAFTGNATKLALGVAGGVAAATTGVVAMANSFAEAGDKAAKTSAALGIGIEAYQELSYAMGQSGLSAQEFDTALDKFNLVVRQGAAGNEAMVKQLDAVGLSAHKLAGMKPEQALERLSDYMQTLPNDAERTRVAVTLFGKTAGPKMMAAMAQGSEGLRQLSQEARDLGIVISKEQAKQAEEYGDAQARLMESFNGMRNQFIGSAIGPLTKAFDHLKDAIVGQMPAIREVGKAFGQWLGDLVKRLPEIIVKIKEFGSWVKNTVTGIKDFVGGWKNLAKILAGLAIAPTFISGLKVVWSLGKFIKIAMTAIPPILAGLKVGLVAMATAAAPIIAIVAGIALAVYTVVRNFDKLKAYAMECFERIKGAFGVGNDGASNFTKVLGTVKKALGIVMGILEGGMLLAIKTVMNTITSVVQMVIGAFKIFWNVLKLIFWPWETIIKVIIGLFIGGFAGALDALKGQFAKLGEIFSGIWGGIKTYLQGFNDFFKNLFRDAIDFVNKIIGGLPEPFQNIFAVIKTVIESFIGFLPGIFEDSIGTIKAIFDEFVGFWKNVFQGAIDAVRGLIEKLPEPFQKVFAGIRIVIDGFIGFWKNIFSSGIEAIKNIVALLPNLFADPIGTIKAIISETGEFFRNVFQGAIDAVGAIVGVLGGIFGGIFNSIKAVIETVADVLKTVFQGPVETVKGTIGSLTGIFTGVFDALKSKTTGFTDFFTGKFEGVKNLFGGIGNVIGGVFGGRDTAVPGHASGGIFTRPHIAQIAEQGAEAVVPLNNSGFDVWKQAGELGGYLKTASEQSPAVSAAASVSAAMPPVKSPEPSPVTTAATQRISSGNTVVNVEFKMTNNFSGGTPDGNTASQISTAGQKAEEDFESKVKLIFDSIMRDRMRVSYG